MTDNAMTGRTCPHEVSPPRGEAKVVLVWWATNSRVPGRYRSGQSFFRSIFIVPPGPVVLALCGPNVAEGLWRSW